MSQASRHNQDPDDLGIELTASEPEQPWGEDPAQREGQALLTLGKPTHDPRFLIGYACLDQILAHGERQTEAEVGGILLGQIWRCARGRVTEVTEILPAGKTEAGLGHVTFSHETWQEIYNELDQRPTGLSIVGWYHTHPGFGVFFSEHDRFIQRHFFAGEGQLGLVVDAQRRAVAAYECRQGEVEELPGLLVATDDQQRGAAQALVRKLTFGGTGGDRGGLLQRWLEPLRNLREGNGGLRPS